MECVVVANTLVPEQDIQTHTTSNEDIYNKNPKSRENRAAESNHEVLVDSPFDDKELENIQQELTKQTNTVMTKYWVEKLEKEATRHWNTFYRRNTTNFFKNRYYIHREIPELETKTKEYDIEYAEYLANPDTKLEPRKVVLSEVGCGVGNAMLPLMEDFPSLTFQACDCAKSAVDLLVNQPSYDAKRSIANVCDISKEKLSFDNQSSDFATLVFVLSALSPNTMEFCLQEVRRILRDDGVLFIRDYALYDMTMLRFKKGSKVADKFYMRGDGTRAYFFEKEEMEDLLRRCGFLVMPGDVAYLRKTVENKKEQLEMKRTWIQVKCKVDPNWIYPVVGDDDIAMIAE